MAIALSNHGVRRLRQRTGIPKRAAMRHARRVMEQGTPLEEHSNPVYKRWVAYAKARHPGDIYLEYGDFIYVFVNAKDGAKVLVSVLYPPHDGAWEN